jgi:hypothetical protein
VEEKSLEQECQRMSDLPKIRYDRLLKLATHLSRGKLLHANFDFDALNDTCDGVKNVTVKCDGKTFTVPHCGTAGCAVGECPGVFPRSWQFDSAYYSPCLISSERIMPSWEDDAKKFFGITYAELTHLFVSRMQKTDRFGGKLLSGHATAKEVAANIRAFVKRGRARKLQRTLTNE